MCVCVVVILNPDMNLHSARWGSSVMYTWRFFLWTLPCSATTNTHLIWCMLPSAHGKHTHTHNHPRLPSPFTWPTSQLEFGAGNLFAPLVCVCGEDVQVAITSSDCGDKSVTLANSAGLHLPVKESKRVFWQWNPVFCSFCPLFVCFSWFSYFLFIHVLTSPSLSECKNTEE